MNPALSLAFLAALGWVVWWASRPTEHDAEPDWPLESDGIYDWADEEQVA
jgi:hypothetical protein